MEKKICMSCLDPLSDNDYFESSEGHYYHNQCNKPNKQADSPVNKKSVVKFSNGFYKCGIGRNGDIIWAQCDADGNTIPVTKYEPPCIPFRIRLPGLENT